jgi:hypothetical protein
MLEMIITIAAVVGACAVLLGVIERAANWWKRWRRR